VIKVKTKLNLKGLERLQEGMKRLNNVVGQYGYFDGKMHKGSIENQEPMTLAEMMLIHETGQGHVERPVFGATAYQLMDSLPSDIIPLLRQYFKVLLKGGKGEDNLLNKIAAVCAEATRDNFGKGNTIGLAPNTMPNDKGRNDPLVDTGELRDELTHRSL
jgi:hypothetical protein